MRKLILLLTVLSAFVSPVLLRAQNIVGMVTDSLGKPLPAATVSLKKAGDSSLVKLSVTDMSGKYLIDGIGTGKYFISASEIGFMPATSGSFEFSGKGESKAPELSMKESSRSLKGVTVEYHKPLIEVRADKMVLNVEGSVNAIGQTAMDLLRKSPGVLVDKDENISLSGKNGVQIYVDGRPVPLSGADLAAYLSNLQSGDIESIEIISNPSAKYDAAGTGGIINIRLKKNKNFGMNGSATAGYNVGIYSKYDGAVSLNYRQNKVNLFGNYSYNQSLDQQYMNLYREDLDTLFDNRSKTLASSRSHNFKAGLDYTINSWSTIGVMMNGTFSNNTDQINSGTPISYIPDSKIAKVLIANNSDTAYRNNANLNLNYHFADTLGHSLDLDANYGIYRIDNTQLQPNLYYDSTRTTLLYGDAYDMLAPTNIDIYNIKADYEQNFEKGKLGYGGKISYVTTANNFQQYDFFNSGKYLDTLSSNDFDYKENINAAYANYNRTLKGWTIQAGLRVENTQITGTSRGYAQDASDLTPYDSTFHRNYTDFFPSAAVTYNKNPMKQWTLTYSRRIDRPAYQDLNPFQLRLDEYTFEKGNTNLRPQYTNSAALTFMYKYTIVTTLNYSNVHNVFTQLVDTTDRSKAFLTKENLATQNIVSLNISSPINYKRYGAFINLNTFYSLYNANFGAGRTINLSVFSFNAYLQQSLRLNHGWTAEMTGFYTTPSIYQGTFRTRSIWSMDLGVQKMVMKGKGTLKASVSDLFNTLHWTAVSDFAGQYLNVNGGYESRQLKLFFSYRFGNNQVKASRTRKTGDEEEAKRVGGGGAGLQVGN